MGHIQLLHVIQHTRWSDPIRVSINGKNVLTMCQAFGNLCSEFRRSKYDDGIEQILKSELDNANFMRFSNMS